MTVCSAMAMESATLLHDSELVVDTLGHANDILREPAECGG